jgi:hypothetical protein
MKRNPSILGVLLSMAGAMSIGSAANTMEYRLRNTSPPEDPEKPKTSAPPKRRFSFFKDRSLAQKEKLAKRALIDMRAARMNYPGWCGRPESGELRKA